MNSWYFLLPSVVREDFCESLVSTFELSQTEDAKFGDGNKDTSYRDTEILGIPFDTKENEWIAGELDGFIKQINAECFGFHLNGICEFQIAKYKEGAHYDNHMDMRMQNRSSTRKLSISVQLSDAKDYEGGEFLFSNDIGTPSQKYIQDKGTIIVFPSFLYHKITPVTKGERYSLVGWYEGNNWF